MRAYARAIGDTHAYRAMTPARPAMQQH